jgi:uracil phosphoribosyltransferase
MNGADEQFYFAAVDEELTDKGYVIPGCGDVGDRLYNSTK